MSTALWVLLAIAVVVLLACCGVLARNVQAERKSDRAELQRIIALLRAHLDEARAEIAALREMHLLAVDPPTSRPYVDLAARADVEIDREIGTFTVDRPYMAKGEQE